MLAQFAVLRVARSNRAGCASLTNVLRNSKFQKIIICATFVPISYKILPQIAPAVRHPPSKSHFLVNTPELWYLYCTLSPI